MKRLNRRKKIWLILLLGLVTFALFAVFNPTLRHELSQLKERFLHGSENTELSKLAVADTLSIEIPDSSLKRIEIHRENAIQNGRLGEEQKEEFLANINWKDEVLNCKLRLKGDFPDHWNGEKWSFRINIKGKNKLDGLDKFSIQDPSTRKHLNEWYFHQLTKDNQLIALSYNFVHVKINGEYKGIYALEESFAKELIERNKRRLGPVLKFDESEWISQIGLDKEQQKDQSEVFQRASIGVFGSSKILSDSVQLAYFNRGKFLLEGLRSGQLRAHEVFDLKKAATLFAIGDLTGAFHGLRWHNQRFYYNPVLDKLEMIGFDSGSGVLIHKTYLDKWQNDAFTETEGLKSWKNALFNSTSFRRYYLEELARISAPDYLTELNKELHDQIQNFTYLMYQENNIYKFDLSVYEHNAEIIRAFVDRQNIQELVAEEYNELRNSALSNSKYESFRNLALDQGQDLTQDTINFSGNLQIEQPVYIPSSYIIQFEAGSKIELTNQAALISYSPIHAVGTEKLPISFTSPDQSASFYLSSPKTSYFEHVHFTNLTDHPAGIHQVTSGVNMIETDLIMNNCLIENTEAEDALNTLNSTIKIDGLTIRNTRSDAYDGDFTTGKLNHLYFYNIGNDAVDFSGSTVEIGEIYAEEIGDKAVSAGESSYITIQKTTINRSSLGLVSKDKSHLTVDSLFAKQLQVALLAFEKKGAYDGAKMVLGWSEIEEYIELYLLEDNSTITLEKNNLEPNSNSVTDEIYGVKYGKMTEK